MSRRTPRAADADDFVGCTIKTLPEHLLVVAGETAVQANPANDVPVRQLIRVLRDVLGLAHDDAAGAMLTPAHIALLRSKWWGPDGVHLTVAFMERTDPELQRKIVHYANRWGELQPGGQQANIDFTLIDTGNPQNADVRVSLGPGGFWSYLGVDIKMIPRNQQTLNLQGFSLSTPDAEFERVPTHEFFHTCGGPHEHMRSTIIARLDPEKTIREFMASQGWSRQEVIAQILTPLSEASLYATPPDEDSIMCYQLSGRCTKDSRPVRGGTRINASDFAFAAKQYPKAVAPPQPPPPPPPPPAGVSITVPVAGTYILTR